MNLLANYPGHVHAALQIGLLLLAIGAAFYARPWLRVRAKWVLPILQTLPAFAILYIIWNPSSMESADTEVPNAVLAIFDTSESMSVADMYGVSRLDYALQAFENTFAPNASDGPEFRIFGFDGDLYEAASANGLRRWGSQSDMWPALDLVRRNAQGQTATQPSHVAGALLFTDGQMSEKSVEALQQIAGDSFRIIVAGVGTEQQAGDVLITRLEAPDQVLVDSSYTAHVSVSGRLQSSASATVEVTYGGLPVGMRQVAAADLAEGVNLEFTVAATTLGLQALQATISSSENENNPVNNVREMAVEVVEEPRLRVLLYSQWAHPDIGKLRQALTRDNKVSLDFVLDALITGPDGRPNQKSAVKFPAGFEALSAYDVLVLGPCESRRFTVDQVRGLYQFVVQRGGGLILLPGEEEFDLAQSIDPDLLALIPATLGRDEWVPNPDQSVVQVTDEGRGFPLPPAKTLAELPGGIAPYYRATPKPAATVVANLLDQPCVIAHRVGRGRVCLINMRPLFPLYREDLQGGELRSLMSGLVTHVGTTVRDAAQVQVFAERMDRDPYRVRVTANVQDAAFQPASGATVLVTLAGNAYRMDESDKGVYSATVATQGEPMLVADVEAVQSGSLVAAHKFTLRLPAIRLEMENVDLDRAFLQRFAKGIGAEYYDAKDLATASVSFTPSSTIKEVSGVTSVWRNWTWLAAVCGLLTLGWFTRRFMGLV